MAKLKAPLMSLGASGAIGKAIVYFPWKGIDCVREYVIPSNPKTAAQVAHRAFLTAAVAMIHTAQADADNPLTSTDQVAYSALASAKGKIMTWFNQAVKLWIDVAVAGKTSCVYSSVNFVSKAAANMSINLFLNEETGSDLAAGKFYFGTSKTNLINSIAADVVAGVAVQIIGEDLSAFLTAGTKYYCQFRPDAADPCEGANSGIYSFVAE